MNGWLLASGILAGVLTLAHGIGGELTGVRALLRDRPAEGDKLELRVTWHLTTWYFALSAAALGALSVRAAPEGVLLRWLLVAGFSGSGIIALALAARQGLRATLRHPQWAVLLAAGALAYWATRPA